MLEMISVLPLTLVCVGSDAFDFRDAEYSICEPNQSCWSSGPGRRRSLLRGLVHNQRVHPVPKSPAVLLPYPGRRMGISLCVGAEREDLPPCNSY